MKYVLLILGVGLLLTAATVTAKPPPTGAPLRPLYTADSTAPPLIASCGTAAASVPLQRWGDAGDTVYVAQFAAFGAGTVTLVAGPNTATLTAPCAACVLTVPAPPPGYLQVSLSLNAPSCPGPGLQLSELNIKVGP